MRTCITSEVMLRDSAVTHVFEKGDEGEGPDDSAHTPDHVFLGRYGARRAPDTIQDVQGGRPDIGVYDTYVKGQ